MSRKILCLIFILLSMVSAQTISLNDAAKFFSGQAHQESAWNWLQGQIPAATLNSFASQYRGGVASTIPFKLVNAAEYYKAISYQVSAFNWLQSQISADKLNNFAALYRATEAPTNPPPVGPSPVLGMDVSPYQPNVDWRGAYANGARFVYIKATEGTGFVSSSFGSQYSGSVNAGLIRGAYHFALPDRSSGSAQANFFVNNGGGWSADGKTLPPALDIEYNPYGSTCYGMGAASMVAWIQDFSNTVYQRTNRYPVIYSTLDWWQTCTGNSAAFGNNNALWIARYSSRVGQLPSGWLFHTFWQFSDHGKLPGDNNFFNGDMAALQRFAKGS
jgi:GH25 family lysozyme M1 (1,4-beta-N-acetylmuramidase)